MRAWRVRWRPDCCWSNSWVGSFGGCGFPLACRTGALLLLYAAGKHIVKLNVGKHETIPYCTRAGFFEKLYAIEKPHGITAPIPI